MKGYPGYTVLAITTVILCSTATNTSNAVIDWRVPEEKKPTITTFDATDITVTRIRKEDVEAFQKLEKLTVSGNNVESVEVSAFESNPELSELDLSHNNFKFPETGEFLLSNSLKVLNVSNNIITEIRNDSLDGLPNLEKLDISWNPIKLFSIEALQSTPKLQELVISKDDNIKPKQICEETNIVTIVIMKDGEDDEEENCAALRQDTSENNSKTIPEDNELKLEVSTEAISVVNEAEGSGEAHDNNNTLIEDSMETTLAPDESTMEIISEETMKHELPEFHDSEEKHKEPEPVFQSTEGNIPAQIQNDLKNDNPPSMRGFDKHKTEESSENDLSSAESKANTGSGISGTNIVLGIIVCIAVVGTISFGYQYWRNHRGYTHTNTEDQDEGKELQTITTIKQNVDDEENK